MSWVVYVLAYFVVALPAASLVGRRLSRNGEVAS